MGSKAENSSALEKERIAQRLRIAREAAGLSQGQAASLLGLHRPSVSETEAGRRAVAAHELVAYAKIYGVKVSWLTGEELVALDPRVQLAARELGKLKPADLSRVMDLLGILGSTGRG